MKALYTATAKTSGGREGKSQTSDGRLEVSLSIPKEMGGPATSTGTNPEQLFAAGYSACFESAIRFVARGRKVAIQTAAVTAEVSLYPRAEGGFSLGVALKVELPELDRKVAEEIVAQAHQICPYSNATRGNLDVQITLA